jgi:uncharacterized SAM-binding protein YcdF (DUF218 family)
LTTFALRYTMRTSQMAVTENHKWTALVLRNPRRIFALAAATFALIFIGFVLCVGRWLVVEDPLEKAQAIVVLSGRMPVRAIEAAKLYREGYAPEVWLTRNPELEATLAPMGIRYVGEEFYSYRVLMHEGVPPEAIRVLPEPIVNTADEMTAVAKELSNHNPRTVILVTTKAHTRRVRSLWRKIGAKQGRAIVRAASGDPFQPGHWWHTSGDALDVVREVLGLLNGWGGLPLHGA